MISSRKGHEFRSYVRTALYPLLMEPPIRRWCSILKVFLVGSLPIGLFMFCLELYNRPDGSVAFFFFWAIFSYASLEYIGIMINLCKIRRMIDYQELVHDAANNYAARIFLYLVNHRVKFFGIVVRAVAWLSKLSGPLHYVGSSVAITLECIICLCFQMDYSSLTYQLFRAYGELMVGQVCWDLFFYGYLRPIELAFSGSVVVICLLGRYTENGTGEPPLLPL